jgi:hypothetical protein
MFGNQNSALGGNVVIMGVVNKANTGGIAIGNFSNFDITTPGEYSVTLGYQGFSCANESIAIGTCSQIFCGATNSVVLGPLSVGGTGSSNSVVIGAGAYTTAACSVAIGNGAFTCSTNSVSIGNAVCNYGPNNVAIGSFINGADTSRNNAVAIGTCIFHTQETLSIGQFISNGTYRGLAIGYEICQSSAGGSRKTVIGQFLDSKTDNGPVQIGVCNTSCSDWSIQIGENNTFDSTLCSSNCSSAIGHNNVNCHVNSSILGNCITTVKTNAAHVNSLVAFGQGASLLNSIASGATAATVNWDDGNNQKIDLMISITSLTLSNPIEGANYMLEIVQGGVGSYTITWPASIKWAFNSPPTLTTTVGGIDVINLFYDGTNYLGTFALNFV